MATQRKLKNKKAFTIVELLTVMSVIIILISLLVPALNEVKRYAKDVKQNAQLHSMNIAIELFEKEFEEYPPSNQYDGDNTEYCGAMKLAEAMLGQDLLGFHPDSLFRADLEDDSNNQLYVKTANDTVDNDPENKSSRKPPYLPLDQAGAKRLKDIYGTGNTNPFDEDLFVLTDVYTRTMLNAGGVKTGMPILYYRANHGGYLNPNESNKNSIPGNEVGLFYKYTDNDDLVTKLGVPWDTTGGTLKHYMASDNNPSDAFPGKGPLEDFYWKINNDNIEIDDGRPYRSDSYILLSAGNDGLYGTRDDIFNFQRK